MSINAARYRFAFLGSNGAHWGGSEELWAASAVELAEAGHAAARARDKWRGRRLSVTFFVVIVPDRRDVRDVAGEAHGPAQEVA